MKIKEYKIKRVGGYDNNGNEETYRQLDTYDGVCYNLGFEAGVNFIKITSAGTISFTCGKPHEIKALYRAVVNNGYVPSAALRNAVRN